MRKPIVISLLCICSSMVRAQVTAETPGWFPFIIPGDDAAPSFTDMSFLNPEPAGAGGRVVIRDGHFYDPRGRRLRLLGSNLTFAGAFPPKDAAPKIAAHLRKLGINVIRFHHMDSYTAPRGLWQTPEQKAFDPQQLDKLDWLIYQLKQHGIYTNLNLHVSRTYPGTPRNLSRTFRYGKGVDNFHRPFIELQKQYATMLLGHRNPYTGTPYADEPAVLVVELNNENALTRTPWSELRALPAPLIDSLTRQWQDWLKQRYGNTEALRRRWDQGSEPLGEELLANGDFDDGDRGWKREQGGGAKMTTQVIRDEEAPGGHALMIHTQKAGSLPWSLQFHQTGLDLQAGRTYTLSFHAKSDVVRRVSIAVRLDQPDWRMTGLNEAVQLTPQWRRFSYTFQCVRPEPQHCRVSFNFNNQLGRFFLAHVSLRPGGWVGLQPEQSLEQRTVALPAANASRAAREDFWRFLADTEQNYVREMRRHLKETIGVKAFICDTQASYGGLFGMAREGLLSDYVDMHSYWQHPRFPGKPWDGNNWNIPNTPMTANDNGGTLTRLAWMRSFGKPYTVSEYDHPAPSDYAAEMFPLLASFAAFQDWDGLYQFNYQSSFSGFDEAKIRGYFELSSHAGKLAFLPVAAVMFRMGAVTPGRSPVALTVPYSDLPSQVTERGDTGPPISDRAGLALQRPVGFRLAPGQGPPRLPEVPTAEGERRSSTGEIVWDAADPERATYTVNAAAVRAAVGFIGGRTISLGDVEIEVTRAINDWAVVAIAALDGKPIRDSARILIAAAGRVENSNMGWNKERTTVGRRWGSAPVVAEGIGARIRLPGRCGVQALDGRGFPAHRLSVQHTATATVVELGPEHRTLWYAVTR